jgi:predicted esterase
MRAPWTCVLVMFVGVFPAAAQPGGQAGTPPGATVGQGRLGEAQEQAKPSHITELFHLEARVVCPVLVQAPADVTSRRAPLLVMLHGRGGTIAGMAALWNALDDPKPILDGFVAQYVIETARAMCARHNCSGVYVMGHSQGVAYAYRAALTDPDLVKGVIAMAGSLDEKLIPDEMLAKAAGKVRVFIAHGRRDEAVSLDFSRKAREVLQSRGYDVVYKEFDGGHEINLQIVRDAQAWMRK